MMGRLTEAQRKALELALDGDLIRWPGGFWALANEPVSHKTDGYEVPARWIAAGTIYALDRKLLLLELGPGESHPWSGPRRITDAGRRALDKKAEER